MDKDLAPIGELLTTLVTFGGERVNAKHKLSRKLPWGAFYTKSFIFIIFMLSDVLSDKSIKYNTETALCNRCVLYKTITYYTTLA